MLRSFCRCLLCVLVIYCTIHNSGAFLLHSQRKQQRVAVIFHNVARDVDAGKDSFISVEEAHDAITKGRAVLLDVRELGELTYAGACGVDYQHIPVMKWEHGMWLLRPEFLQEVVDQFGDIGLLAKEISPREEEYGSNDDSCDVLVLSRDGGARTAHVVDVLLNEGFNVQGIEGGFEAWDEAGLPLDEYLGYGGGV